MGTAVTIHGGSGADTINFAFTVTGTNTTRYTERFATFVNNRLAGGDPLILATPIEGAHAGGLPPANVPIYELVPSTVVGGSNSYGLSTNGYVIDTISGAATLSLNGDDTVLVAGINAASVIGELGNDNRVIFVSGDNVFNGDMAAGAGDTIVGGSGDDTIYTGGGSATVNSGTGHATIYLQDTAVGSTINDSVWLDDGQSIVYANGANDAVIATVGGQTISGALNTATSSNLTVVLTASSNVSTNVNGDTVTANNLVIGGVGSTLVYDGSSGNTVDGGAGGLYFIGASSITAALNGGGGNIVAFGADGDTITFGNTTGTTTGLTELIAGTGNETLDGGSATTGIALYGTADSTGSDLLTGGAGNDTIQAGVGSETLTGGAGDNLFLFNSATDGGTITIADFLASSGNNVAFSGYSPSDIQSALQSGTESDGNYTVTLSDNTSITFDNVTGYSELNGHIITF
jgi:Ca2+-binding RTX toxin-like protein